MTTRRKRYRSVIAAVYREPWCILQSKLEDILGFIDLKRDGLTVSAETVAAVVGSRRSPQPQSPATGVVVLNVLGTIMPRASGIEQASGIMSLAEFGAAFDAAMANERVGTIIGYFDTPGGAVQGIPEMVAKIKAARGQKKLIAFGDGTLASAGLWLASAFDEIVVSPSANSIGSVGALSPHYDETGALEKAGITRTYLTSDKSPFKAEGAGPLTPEAKAHMIGKLNVIYDQFAGDLSENLGVSVAHIEEHFGKGRTLMAKDAMAAGMVHRIATFEQVLSELGVVSSSSAVIAAVVPSPSVKGENMTTQVEAGAPPVGEPKKIETPPGTPAVLAPQGMSAADIVATIKLASIPDAEKMNLTAELVGKASTMSVSAILDRVNTVATEHNKPAGATRIEAGVAESEKFITEARDAMLSRSWAGNLPTKIYSAVEDDFVAWKPSSGGRDYSLQSSIGLAQRCLIQSGMPTHQVQRLAPETIAQLVMGASPRSFGIMAGADTSYNVTGMFSNIFYDASNVMLRRAYTEVNTTFQRWMKQGESLKDFKPVHKIIAGELPDPKAIPEDGEFEETTTTDGRESYKLTVWGERFSISWQAIVNDQLSAFADIPVKQGRAMRRKQNKLAYGVLRDNANLSDGGALFNATALTTTGGHNNLATGAATPTVATLNAMKARMRSMTGLNVSDATVLNLEPKFILSGGAIEGTIRALLRSTADPAASQSGVANIWEGSLEPIFDEQMGVTGGGSDTAWYLACDNRDVDTIEYAYLQGLESPRLLQRDSQNTLGMKFDIYQAFAVKALDFRGLQKHAGA